MTKISELKSKPVAIPTMEYFSRKDADYLFHKKSFISCQSEEALPLIVEIEWAFRNLSAYPDKLIAFLTDENAAIFKLGLDEEKVSVDWYFKICEFLNEKKTHPMCSRLCSRNAVLYLFC